MHEAHACNNGIFPETQCGFRAGRGTADMIFTARQLQEKCREQHKDLYAVFVDLLKHLTPLTEKAFGKS